MIISVTERQLFKRCRRKWDLSSFNRQSLKPILNAPALDLGTIIHATLAAWTEDPGANPNEIYDQQANNLMLQIVTDYNTRIGCAPSQEELLPITQAITLGRSMIANYQKHWHTPLPAGYTLVQNEQTLVIPIPDTLHCQCLLSVEMYEICTCEYCARTDDACAEKRCSCIEQHKLEATLDGIIRDELGQLFIIERKTYSRRPSIEELDHNDQFLAYMWALKQVDIGPVRGVSYDGLFKRDKPAQGKVLSDMFLRRILMRPQQEIDEFQTLLALEANEMANPQISIYKTVPPLGGCWDCSYHTLCDAMSQNAPQVSTIRQMYMRSNHKQWRDEDDNT